MKRIEISTYPNLPFVSTRQNQTQFTVLIQKSPETTFTLAGQLVENLQIPI